MYSQLNWIWWIDDSNKVIINRLQQQWNNCTNEQREPYEVICAEDLQHYKELLQDEGEK